MHLGRALADSTNDSKDKDENEDKRKQDQQKGDQQGKPHSRRRDGNGSKGSVSLGRDTPPPHEQEPKRGPTDLCHSTHGGQEFAGLLDVGLLDSQAESLSRDVVAGHRKVPE